MNQKKKWDEMKKAYEEVTIPEGGKEALAETIGQAKRDKRRKQKINAVRKWGVAVAAALAILILPNVNENIAYAMGNVPIVGTLFRVITVREYQYDNGKQSVSVEVPGIASEEVSNGKESGKDAMSDVNKSVKEYTDQLIDSFEKEMKKEGYADLDVSYDVVTNDDEWFTLVIHGEETQASAFQFNRYYHIDKKSGKEITLKDLFKKDVDYVTVISDEIKKQMAQQIKEEGKSYWLEDDGITEPFQTIKEDQNFYLNADGEIVIVFDEYEVAPGYMGCPEFTIPSDVISL
ncbi:MAG: RsiV family protein [Clostridiales bacterium]|nr:RsiV family protein [Clostridiales bacterium]